MKPKDYTVQILKSNLKDALISRTSSELIFKHTIEKKISKRDHEYLKRNPKFLEIIFDALVLSYNLGKDTQ